AHSVIPSEREEPALPLSSRAKRGTCFPTVIPSEREGPALPLSSRAKRGTCFPTVIPSEARDLLSPTTLPRVDQIPPRWIDRLDQRDLLLPPPPFQHLLARDRRMHVVGVLGVDEPGDPILLRKTFDGAAAVLQ